jgi:hypothetical protein
MAPYNLAYAVIGASLLWVGWFGFNAGSAVAANGRAGMAMTVTQIATAAAALGWMFAEWVVQGQTVGARCGFRRGRRPRGDHAGVGLRAAGRSAGDWHRGRRRLLLVRYHASSTFWAMTTAWTRLACMASAASSARC